MVRKRSHSLQATKNEFFLTSSNIIKLFIRRSSKCLLKETKLKEKNGI